MAVALSMFLRTENQFIPCLPTYIFRSKSIFSLKSQFSWKPDLLVSEITMATQQSWRQTETDCDENICKIFSWRKVCTRCFFSFKVEKYTKKVKMTREYNWKLERFWLNKSNFHWKFPNKSSIESDIKLCVFWWNFVFV